MAAILVFCHHQTQLTLAKIGSHHLHKRNFTHSFWLNCDDGSHLEFCHVGFRHLPFSDSEIHLSYLLSDSLQNWLSLKVTLTLTQTNSIWFDLMMATILNSVNLGFSLVFPLKLWLTIAKIGSHYLHSKKPLLIHSDWTWWWQPSWILPILDSAILHKSLDTDT